MANPQKILAWSYSRWKTYDQCPRKARYNYIDKLPQPESEAMARGSRIHKMAEDYLNGKIAKVGADLKHFAAYLKQLKSEGAGPEHELTFTNTWSPTGWFAKDAWLRIKVDVISLPERSKELLIVDWKTGKKYDDHIQQCGLYALGGLITPEAHDAATVRTKLCYTDTGEEVEEVFKRSETESLRKLWLGKTRAMLNDTKFAPLPSRSCMWCPYSKSKGGPCEF